MATGSFLQVYVECPFYKEDDARRRISCEGIVDDSKITISFLRKRDFDIQMNTFCCEHYKKCEIYRMLMEKYKEDLGPDWDDTLGGGQ